MAHTDSRKDQDLTRASVPRPLGTGPVVGMLLAQVHPEMSQLGSPWLPPWELGRAGAGSRKVTGSDTLCAIRRRPISV